MKTPYHFVRIFMILFFLCQVFLTGILSAQPLIRPATENKDLAVLRELNAKFIHNYVTHDTVSHNQVIHKDFVCIESSGQIVDRKHYMKEWASSYTESGFTSFDYTEEFIRLFGNTALVRSKTVSTRIVNGVTVNGSSIYTDTYIKENGRWWCVQAQITAIKKP